MGCCCVKATGKTDTRDGAVNPAFDAIEDDNVTDHNHNVDAILHVIPEDQKPYRERAIDVDSELENKRSRKKAELENIQQEVPNSNRKDEVIVMARDVQVNLDEKIEKFQVANTEPNQNEVWYPVAVHPKSKKTQTGKTTENNTELISKQSPKIKNAQLNDKTKPLEQNNVVKLENILKETSDHSTKEKLDMKQLEQKYDQEKSIRLISKKITSKADDVITVSPVCFFHVLSGHVSPPPEKDIPEIRLQPYQNTFKPSGKVINDTNTILTDTIFHIEDGFWTEKRKLIPSLTKLKDIERHANQVCATVKKLHSLLQGDRHNDHPSILEISQTPDNMKTSPEALAAYLVTPAKTEIEKLRSIFWWLAHNIKYDVRLLNDGIRGDNSPEDVLRTGYAVCQGYAQLATTMLKSVGIDCETISGTSKGASYWPGCYKLDPNSSRDCAHAWNKVKVGGTWYLMDATWSAGSCGTETGRWEFNFKWDEQWFLTPPEDFLETHLPLKGGKFNPKNPLTPDEIDGSSQLLDQPVTDFDAWENKPALYPACGIVGLETVSHPEGVLYTKTNEVHIQLKTKIKTELWVDLENINRQNGPQLNDFVWISNNGVDIEISARFPGRGMYSLTVVGRPWRLESLPKSHNDIWIRVDYTVVAEGSSPKDPFPKGTKDLGPSLDILDIGFEVLQPDEPVIETNNAQAHVVLKLPKYDLIPFKAKLVGADNKYQDPSRLVHMERSGNVCIIHVICPGPGEYLLNILLPKSDKLLYTGASYLIKCNKQLLSSVIFPPEGVYLFGPDQRFFSHGVKVLYPSSSTVYATDGECSIVTRQDHVLERFHRLFDVNGNQLDDRHVYEETSGNTVTYHLRLPNIGMYRLGISVCEPGTEDWGGFAARFLIIAPKAYNDQLFPEGLDKDCGWNDTQRLGFKYHGDKSTVSLSEDTFNLGITLLEDITIAAILQPLGKWFYPDINGDKAEIPVTLPAEQGEYSVQLMKKKSKDENRWNTVLGFFVIRKQ